MFPIIISHNVQVVQNVGVTFHIEPNHTPKAKHPSLAWFALTHRGGRPIPLSQCRCLLRVFSAMNRQRPLLQPPLQPIDKEQYQEIPSATIVFPQAGKYYLELTGSPIQKGAFSEFKVVYDVIVKK